MIEVDARGLSCPIPVVRSKKAIDENPGDKILVIVNEATQRDNVTRLAKSRGYNIKVEEVQDEYRLELKPA